LIGVAHLTNIFRTSTTPTSTINSIRNVIVSNSSIGRKDPPVFQIPIIVTIPENSYLIFALSEESQCEITKKAKKILIPIVYLNSSEKKLVYNLIYFIPNRVEASSFLKLDGLNCSFYQTNIFSTIYYDTEYKIQINNIFDMNDLLKPDIIYINQTNCNLHSISLSSQKSGSFQREMKILFSLDCLKNYFFLQKGNIITIDLGLDLLFMTNNECKIFQGLKQISPHEPIKCSSGIGSFTYTISNFAELENQESSENIIGLWVSFDPALNTLPSSSVFQISFFANEQTLSIDLPSAKVNLSAS